MKLVHNYPDTKVVNLSK